MIGYQLLYTIKKLYFDNSSVNSKNVAECKKFDLP